MPIPCSEELPVNSAVLYQLLSCIQWSLILGINKPKGAKGEGPHAAYFPHKCVDLHAVGLLCEQLVSIARGNRQPRQEAHVTRVFLMSPPQRSS